MTRLQELRSVMATAVIMLERARAAARAEVVPEADIAPHSEPVTVSGWYQRATRSGRPAWQYCYWKSGRLLANRPVYNREVVDRFEMAAWAWREARREYKEELRFAQIKSALLVTGYRATVGLQTMTARTVPSSPVCEDPAADDLVAFIDGELDAASAQRFRDHVGDCAICSAGLLEGIQMTARISMVPTKGG